MPPKTKIKKSTKKSTPVKTISTPARSNRTVLWIVIAFLAILILIILTIGAVLIFTFSHFQNDKWGGMDSVKNPSEAKVNGANNEKSTAEGFLPPSASEKNMGYIKKVYTKAGKNFIDIDYIQWLSGTEAEKAMREDGQCPKTGECIVYDDYYIRNQNPQIRSLEVAPDADIRMMTLDSETTGRVDENKKITFDQLKSIFTPGTANQQRYQFTPFIIELSSNKIVKITEQYIP